MSIHYRFITTFFIIIINFNLISQNQTNNWCFGNNIGLNFSCAPIKQFKSSINSSEGCSTISDSLGNLLFYTDGDSVWDKEHNLMPNGTGLGARCSGFSSQSSTQSCLIVQKPGNTTIYYIFTTDCLEDNYLNGFRYSIIDMSLNTGKGDVVSKNILLNNSTTEKVTGIMHTNNLDVWIICHEINNNIFKSYLLTNTGISLTPFISLTGQTHNSGRCYLKFSPNGTKLVSLVPGLNPEIFSFNPNTGSIISDYILPDINFTQYYGASFSPNNNYLYLSCINWICGAKLHQYDLSSSNPAQVMASKYVIDEPTNTNNGGPLGALQLGLDGKIYFPSMGEMIGNDFVSYIGVIDKPNNLGPLVEYNAKKIKLRCNRYCGYGTPNFIESYFQSPISIPFCTDLDTNFKYEITECTTNASFHLPNNYKDIGLASISWDFDDSLSGLNNTSQSNDPNHVFSSYGTYKIKVIINYCQGSDTLTKLIDIMSCENINDISIPNIVTSNNDGINDTFKINGIEYFPHNNLTVFNRWGNVIYSNPDYQNNWKPNSNSGTYFYVLKLEDGRVFKGFLEIFSN